MCGSAPGLGARAHAWGCLEEGEAMRVRRRAGSARREEGAPAGGGLGAGQAGRRRLPHVAGELTGTGADRG
jgi:hypothetical protein